MKTRMTTSSLSWTNSGQLTNELYICQCSCDCLIFLSLILLMLSFLLIRVKRYREWEIITFYS